MENLRNQLSVQEQAAFQILKENAVNNLVKDADDLVDFKIMRSREPNWTKAQQLIKRLVFAGLAKIINDQSSGNWIVQLITNQNHKP